MRRNGRGVWTATAVATALLVAGCSTGRVANAPVAAGPPSTTSHTAAPTTSAPPPSPSPTATRRPTPDAPDWVGDRSNAVAFAPVDDPDAVTVEGDATGAEAWSTSKVLVVAAFLDTVADGDPGRLTSDQRRLVERSLTRSDGDAVSVLRGQIPGRPGRAMTAVLRSIGDDTTIAPDQYEGLMRWSVREQVRFMAALASGDVVSRAASAYLLKEMRPIPEHAWGLGTIGSSAYKGGWLRDGRVTRQMGLVDGYAVAILTDSVGPVVVQTDGDAAHVRQMDRLAAELEERLAEERG